MSKKRQVLIDTALDLFYKNGVNSIGINQILKVSGIAKKRYTIILIAKKR